MGIERDKLIPIAKNRWHEMREALMLFHLHPLYSGKIFNDKTIIQASSGKKGGDLVKKEAVQARRLGGENFRG